MGWSIDSIFKGIVDAAEGVVGVAGKAAEVKAQWNATDSNLNADGKKAIADDPDARPAKWYEGKNFALGIAAVVALGLGVLFVTRRA